MNETKLTYMTNVQYYLLVSMVAFGLASSANANDNNVTGNASINKIYNKLIASNDAHLNGEAKPDKVIIDISSWTHPTKKYFNVNYGYKLTKVELYKNSTYPVFYVDIIKKNTDSNNMTWSIADSYNIAKANGGWPFDIKFHYNNKYIFTLTNTFKKQNDRIDLRISYYGRLHRLSFIDAYNLLKTNNPSYFKNKYVSYSGEESGVEIHNMNNPKYFIWLRNMKADMAGTVGRFLISPDSGVIVDWDDLNM